MKGTVTKCRKKDGRISWGYYYKAGGEQFTKGGFATKDAASEASPPPYARKWMRRS